MGVRPVPSVCWPCSTGNLWTVFHRQDRRSQPLFALVKAFVLVHWRHSSHCT